MVLTLKKHLELMDVFTAAAKHLDEGSVGFDQRYDNDAEGGQQHLIYLSAARVATLKKLKEYFTAGGQPLPLAALKVESMKTFRGTMRQLAGIAEGRSVSHAGSCYDCNITIPSYGPFNTLTSITQRLAPKHKSIKLVPDETPLPYVPAIIQQAPAEVMEKGSTYRILTGWQFDTLKNVPPYTTEQTLNFMASETDDIYDYLDEGFCIMRVMTKATKIKKSTAKYIVSNAYDINTAHIFAMCQIQPELASLLQKGCYISSHAAEITRLKMTKKLSVPSKKTYGEIAAIIDNDYRKSTNLVIVSKLKNGELPQIRLNDVTITATSASYENVSVEYPGMANLLYDKLNFNGEFDVYTIIDIVGADVVAKLDAPGEKNREISKKLRRGVKLQDGEKVVDKDEREALEIPAFKINDMDITVVLTKDGQRKVNGVRINKVEVGQVLHRASCYHKAEGFNSFLKATSRMSILWHDIIANGLPVKMHENITDREYQDPIPGPAAPALKLFYEPKKQHIMLDITADRALRVSLRTLISKINTVNKNTNNSWVRRYNYGQQDKQNFKWARAQAAQALIDATATVTKEADGTKTTKAQITLKDIEILVGLVIEDKSKAILRSKEFLNTAIKLTGATAIRFKDKDAYLVEGKLRKYAVIIENAKVYDYDTQQYRCIVNDHHYEGAGYDDIAARLLALKNDSSTQDQIRTLAGAAQPNAENAHADYRPERDNGLAALAALPEDAVIDDMADIEDKGLIAV